MFGNQLSCCEYLVSTKSIDASLGLTGSGLCSRSYFDPSFKQVRARCMDHPGGRAVSELQVASAGAPNQDRKSHVYLDPSFK